MPLDFKHTPLFFLPLLILIISVGLSQVSPSYQPYSLIHPQIELPATQLTIADDDINLDFTDNAQISNHPDGIIYRLVIQLNGIQSGHLSISNWQVPEQAMLFIFNDEKSYTGPYLSKNSEAFVSGRFISDKLTLEYFVPINTEFTEYMVYKGDM